MSQILTFGRAKELLASLIKKSFSRIKERMILWMTMELSIFLTFAKIKRINAEFTLPFMVVQWE